MPRVGLLLRVVVKYLFVSPFLFLFCLVSSCPRFFELEPRTRPIQTHMTRSQCCWYRKLYVAPGRTTESLSLSPFSLSLSIASCHLFITPGRTATSLYPFFCVFSTRRALVSSPRVGLQKYLSLPYFSSLVVPSFLHPWSNREICPSLSLFLFLVSSCPRLFAPGWTANCLSPFSLFCWPSEAP